MAVNNYLGVVPNRVEIHGDQWHVGVHLAEVRGQLTCVGLDLRAVNVADLTAGPPATDETGAWLPVTTAMLRAVPLTKLIDQAADVYRAASPGQPADSADRPVPAPLRPRRGPRPALTDEQLERVVAPAYRLSARRPVQAVHQALRDSGLLPDVTLDQTRRIVQRARALGFIPPVNRAGTNPEENR